MNTTYLKIKNKTDISYNNATNQVCNQVENVWIASEILKGNMVYFTPKFKFDHLNLTQLRRISINRSHRNFKQSFTDYTDPWEKKSFMIEAYLLVATAEPTTWNGTSIVARIVGSNLPKAILKYQKDPRNFIQHIFYECFCPMPVNDEENVKIIFSSSKDSSAGMIWSRAYKEH